MTSGNLCHLWPFAIYLKEFNHKIVICQTLRVEKSGFLTDIV